MELKQLKRCAVNLLDTWMPDYHFSEHHSLSVSASEVALWNALKTVTPDEIGPLRWLMAIRSFPAKVAGLAAGKVRKPGKLFARGTPILDLAVNSNFVLLEERAPNQIALGMAGQFWKLDGGPRVNVHNAHDFAAFHQPGFLRVTVAFQIGAGKISTETRVQALDEDARRKFSRYWTLIRPGSGWIRMAWLRAIDNRARLRT